MTIPLYVWLLLPLVDAMVGTKAPAEHAPSCTQKETKVPLKLSHPRTPAVSPPLLAPPAWEGDHEYAAFVHPAGQCPGRCWSSSISFRLARPCIQASLPKCSEHSILKRQNHFSPGQYHCQGIDNLLRMWANIAPVINWGNPPQGEGKSGFDFPSWMSPSLHPTESCSSLGWASFIIQWSAWQEAI